MTLCHGWPAAKKNKAHKSNSHSKIFHVLFFILVKKVVLLYPLLVGFFLYPLDFFLYPLDFFLFFMVFPGVFPLVFLSFVFPVILGFGFDLEFFFFRQVFLQCFMVTFFVLHLFFFRLLHVFAIHCFWQFSFCILLIHLL